MERYNYKEMRRKYPDAILLFKVGDFYEALGNDAVECSNILGIVLTRRASDAQEYVELAGFPCHALDIYLPKLVRAGRRVCTVEECHKLLREEVKRWAID